MLRFKRTWKQSMSFHYWLLLWWRRLRLLFKASQNALNRTDEWKFFLRRTHALDGRLHHPWAPEWKFMLTFIGVVDLISWDFAFSYFFFLRLIMPYFLWVQTFQIDFGSKGFRSWILGLHRSSRLIHTHCLDSFNIFWICQTIIWILRAQSKIFFLNHLMGQGMVILIPGNKCGVNSFQWWHIEGRTFLKLNEAKQLCS